jgi:predicted translin family RNA/ssDNA-binding protein
MKQALMFAVEIKRASESALWNLRGDHLASAAYELEQIEKFVIQLKPELENLIRVKQSKKAKVKS